MFGWCGFCGRGMSFHFILLLLCRRYRSLFIRTLPSPSRGERWSREIQALLLKGAIEPASPTPGVLQPHVCGDQGVRRVEAHHRPLHSEQLCGGTPFWLEITQLVLQSFRRKDWMVSVDLKYDYLYVPIHPSNHRFLQFVVWGRTWQFWVLCFGLTTAPQVFTRVMAPVLAFLHRMGVRILRYLDDWLILASSRESVIWARNQVLELRQALSIVINLEKSALSPAQSVDYLGVRIDLQTFRASPTPLRTEKFFLIVGEFLSSGEQSAKSWRVLLGHLASLIHLVPGSRLRLRSLQLALCSGWDFVDEFVLVAWDDPCQNDLLWWYDKDWLTDGVFLESQFPELMFWSGMSDQGWGAHCVRPFPFRSVVRGGSSSLH